MWGLKSKKEDRLKSSTIGFSFGANRKFPRRNGNSSGAFSG